MNTRLARPRAWRLALATSVALVAATVGSYAWADDDEPAQFVTRLGQVVFVGPGEFGIPQAFCGAHEQATGSGFGGSPGLEIIASLPLRADGAFAGEGDIAVGWQFTMRNTTPLTLLVHARVICASNRRERD